MGFEHKNPTRFPEEFRQHVIVWFLLFICLLVFLSIISFLHQVGDAVAFKPSILAVFAFLAFVFVRVGWFAVLPLLPVFLWARHRAVVFGMVRVGQIRFFDCWSCRVPAFVILSFMQCIHTVLVGTLALCLCVLITQRIFITLGNITIPRRGNVCCGVSAVCTTFIVWVFIFKPAVVCCVWWPWPLGFLRYLDIRTGPCVRNKTKTCENNSFWLLGKI